MNKHKEALKKIVEVTLAQSTANKIATEALQSESEQPKSESRMYSEDEVIGFGIWLGEKYWFNLSTYKWECRNEEGLYEVLDSKQLMELYRQSLQPKTEELKEGLKPCPNHPDVLTSQCGICNGDFPKLEQPKTEEVTYGEWMRSNPERPLYDFPNKKICFKSCEQSTIDLGQCDCHNSIMDRFLMPSKEQPTSTSIEKEDKISKLTFDKEISQWVDIYSYELGLMKGKEEGYKANNSLDELDKWVREERYHYGNDINAQELMNKLYQLKTKP